MVNYQLGKIYKIIGNGLTYIGSTCEPTLARRLSKHVTEYRRYLNGLVSFITSFKCFENNYEGYDIILIENYPCETKDQLHMRERFFIETIDCVNKCIPITTDEEKRQWYEKWYDANRVRFSECHKEYHKSHREQISNYQEKYRKDNKEKIKKYRDEHKGKAFESMKIYRVENKEKIREQRKQYREKNKEAILEKQKQYREAKKLKKQSE